MQGVKEWRSTLACAVFALVFTALPQRASAAQDPASESSEPEQVADSEPEAVAAPRLPGFAPSYRDFAAIDEVLSSWIAAFPEHASWVDLARTRDGRRIRALQIHQPGDVPIEERPTLILLGGLDGVSLAGGEAVLATAHALLSDLSAWSPDTVFIALPWAAPEALELTLRDGSGDGRNRVPTDEDHDGRADEDGPDDIDGDGQVLSMLIEDPEGKWVRAEDGRFLRRARPGDSPRYALTREGRDDDGDGSFNEDPVGGVVLDLNFPSVHGAHDPQRDGRSGPLPMSEPMARALAELAIGRRTAAVICFQGDHGGVGIPRALFAATQSDGVPADLAVDLPSLEAALRAWFRARGTVPALVPCAQGDASGSAVDWFYEALGILALEVAPWGPQATAPDGASGESWDWSRVTASARTLLSSPLMESAAWTKWIDDTRGGLGFRDWVPVELGSGLKALVGGWEPFARLNPPEADLAANLEGMSAGAIALAGMLPRLDVRTVSVRREGAVVSLSVRVGNTGSLPTGLWPAERWRHAGDPCGARLEIELPPGAELLAGEKSSCLGRLLGGQASAVREWIVLLPEGDVVSLRATAPASAPAVAEVAP